MESMFLLCENLKTVNVSAWELKSATNISLMFFHCYALDLSSLTTDLLSKRGSLIAFSRNIERLDILNIYCT